MIINWVYEITLNGNNKSMDTVLILYIVMLCLMGIMTLVILYYFWINKATQIGRYQVGEVEMNIANDEGLRNEVRKHLSVYALSDGVLKS